uniref:Uncharacterized protein n=1 Tax=Paramoeba aestuarina TaxID=180227 RepID=A0A7S4KZ59_9EUKA|mmetsp:Transcript_28244/g.43746  ORF Transcript_28244/g.43746 Transcript_28244/m.43746 type:complete len:355 (+) Transcript_28244:48-1112(+)
MQAIVWRPKTERHWVYLCNLFSQLQKLESGENLNSESQEEDAYMYEEDRKRKRRQERQQQEGPPRKLRRKSAKDKETEFFQELEKKEEKKEEEKRSEHERLKIRLANTQYVLKYLLGIFQENLKNNPPLGERHILWSLIGCETKGDTDYGGEKGERLRKLFHLLFEVFAVGKRISCSLVMCLFEQVWKSVDGPTFNESLPGIFSEFKSLEEAKKREFLESLYNNEFRLQLVTYILTDIGSKKEVKDAKKWEQSPLTVEKISQYYLHLLPQAEGKKGGNAATREKAEESHCLLVSFLIQSYVVQYRDHLIKNPHEFTALQNEVEKWVGRRKRKATKALSSYLHRSQACFHFIKIE